jgi:hypothetical protein
MVQRTMKNDWLNDFLARIPGMIVSDHLSFSKMIGLSAQDNAAIRFVANRNQVFTYILTIQSNMAEWHRVKKTLTSNDGFGQLLTTIRDVLKYPTPILLYDNNYSDKYSIAADLKGFHDVDDLSLHSFFTNLNEGMTKDPGNVGKQINRSVNDSFQVWTRRYLSRYVVVNDFDALLIREISSQLPIVFELKRIQEDVDTWEPYIDDQANYAAILHICQTINAIFYTIAYQIDRTDLIALHTITRADKYVIEGSMITCHPNDILRSSTKSVPHSYRSSRRRQR